MTGACAAASSVPDPTGHTKNVELRRGAEIVVSDDGQPELALHGTGAFGDYVDLKLRQACEDLIGSGEVELRHAGENQKPGAKLALAFHGVDLDSQRSSPAADHRHDQTRRAGTTDLLVQFLVVDPGREEERISGPRNLHGVLDGLEGSCGAAPVVGIAAGLGIDEPDHGHNQQSNGERGQALTANGPYSVQ